MLGLASEVVEGWWSLVSLEVSQGKSRIPILGADFLVAFDLLVDVHRCRLVRKKLPAISLVAPAGSSPYSKCGILPAAVAVDSYSTSAAVDSSSTAAVDSSSPSAAVVSSSAVVVSSSVAVDSFSAAAAAVVISSAGEGVSISFQCGKGPATGNSPGSAPY